LTKNISEKEIKTAPTKDSQTDLAEPTLTVSLALRRRQKERRRGREKPKKPYSIASSSPTPCYVTKNQTEKKKLNRIRVPPLPTGVGEATGGQRRGTV
jgi:hypothetical protein